MPKVISKNPTGNIAGAISSLIGNPDTPMEYAFQNTHIAKALPSVQKEYKMVGLIGHSEKDCISTPSANGDPGFVMIQMEFKAVNTADSPNEEIKTLDQLKKFFDKQKLTRFDLAVMNAVYVLWKRRENKSSNEANMTFSEIYCTMNGLPGIHRIKPVTTDSIRKSVSKMLHLVIEIDTKFENSKFADNLAAHQIRKGGVTAESLILSSSYYRTHCGYDVGGITVFRCPILCRYAEAAGCIMPMPQNILSVRTASGKQIKLTERSAGFRSVLAEHVTLMKKGKVRGRKIGLRTITEAAGYDYDDLDRKRKQRDRELVETILTHFVQVGYLNGFTINVETKMVEFQV